MKNLIIAFFLCISCQSYGQLVSTTKTEKLQKLMKVIGSEEMFKDFNNSGLDQIINKYADDLSEKDRLLLREESLKLVETFLNEGLVNIYDKFLSEKEIDDLIKFYSSNTGKRFRRVQPLINQEIYKAMVRDYHTEFQALITTKYKEKGF